MEIKCTNILKPLVRLCLCAFGILAFEFKAAAQPARKYGIQNGKMVVTIGKEIKDDELDQFIQNFELHELALKRFIRQNYDDSIRLMGWQIDKNNSKEIIISKSLIAIDKPNPADMIVFAERQPPPPPFFDFSNKVVFGNNRFKNKKPFAEKGQTITFYLRSNLKAKKVTLAGSFNNWDPDKLEMTRTDSGWIAQVTMPPGKYWYKFVVDGRWMIDTDNNLRENDGEGNINSVFFKANTVFETSSFSKAKKVYLAGSFTNWERGKIEMLRNGDRWELPVYLGEGTHTYKFIVDGRWHFDEKNKNRLPDGHGSFNSVLSIGEPYLFRLKGYENAEQVLLVGSFNGWKPDELFMEKKAGGWELPYVVGPGNYGYRFIVDGKWIADPDNPYTIKDQKNLVNSYLIVQPNYTFRLKGKPDAKEVYIAGDFNGWAPNQLHMKKEGDEWVFNLHLGTGKHRYKFIVDGEWITDPANKLWEQNEYGTGNSIVWIEK